MNKEFQPALHRKLIKEGKMTEQESENLVREWEEMMAEQLEQEFSEEYPLGGSLEPYDIVEEH